MKRICALCSQTMVLLLIVVLLILTTHTTAVSSSAASTTTTEDSIIAILEHLETHRQTYLNHAEDVKSRPWVSLCFAQSLDGKLAMYYTDNDGDDTTSNRQTTSNLAISGQASLLLTHALRSAHEAILVGGRTLSTDNPRLSNRLWQHNASQPRPVVLDPSLRNLERIGGLRKARNLLVCCSSEVDIPDTLGNDLVIVPCRTRQDGSLDLADVLDKLRRDHGIRSLMVEGGPTVLSMFLEAHMFDCLTITIAPTIFGSGIGITLPHSCSLKGDIRLARFDNDICVVAFPDKSKGTSL